MAGQDPSTTVKSSSSFAPVAFGVFGLLLLAGAIALGWRLSRVKNEQPPPPPVVAATPAPVAPPENPAISAVERQAVLRRIDLMPNVSAENKEQLYAYVDRAHGLKRLLTVSFETGRTRLSDKEATRLERAGKQPSFGAMVHNTAAVFVVLGYADQRGDEKKSLLISTERANSVMELLRKRCAVQNAIQTIPMGSPQLFNPKGALENRVAEIWAVLP